MSDESVGPKVNDSFWFDYSETLVSSAQEKREKAAGSLQKLVIWLWGIYTASAAVGFTLSDHAPSFWPTFIIASASALLIAVYWGTVWIQMPILLEFDPRSPTEISEAHRTSVVIMNSRLRVTVFLSILAAIMVSLSIIFASVSTEQKNLVPGFEALIHLPDKGRILALTGYVGKAEKVIVYVRPILSDSTSVKTHSFALIPSENGFIQTSLSITMIKPDSSNLYVTLQWVDSDSLEVKISKIIQHSKNRQAK